MEKRQPNLKGLRREIFTLKSKLSEITHEKENWFKEKEAFKKQIRDLVDELRAVKSTKDSFNITCNELKKSRDEYNQKVSKLIADIKKLRNERKDLVKELDIKLEPDKIKERIKFLEEKIETEVLPFKKEGQLMGEIKSLKKALSESSAVTALDQKIDSISKLIDEARQKSQEFHTKLKDHIQKHKKGRGYKDFISLYKQIEFLKLGQEKAFKMFMDFKTKFFALNKLLSYKLFEEKKIKGKIEDISKKRAEEKRMKEEILIDKKLKAAEEKLRTKKKLTTEDLVGFRK